jgi:hypothetical protein
VVLTAVPAPPSSAMSWTPPLRIVVLIAVPWSPSKVPSTCEPPLAIMVPIAVP